MPPLKEFTFESITHPNVKVVIEAYDQNHADKLLHYAIGESSNQFIKI